MRDKQQVTRRTFIQTGAAGAAAGAVITGMPYLAQAQGAKRVLKTGLIGCGGRAKGAMRDHLNAAKDLNDRLNLNLEIQVVGVVDWDKKKAENYGKSHDLPPERCFGGAEGYKQLLEINPDIVLMATPPVFRPRHLEACVNAGKHVFFEKPVAVDPRGVRTVLAAGEMAKQKGLTLVAGTQRRHESRRCSLVREIREGAYGRIMEGRVAWDMGKIFKNTPIHPKSPDDLVTSGNWQLWVEMSGDHICEQHVHNIDIANWYLGAQAGWDDDSAPELAATHPVSARGYGFRARRVAGNMYDFFSIDLEYPNGIHIHSTCRQVGGCSNWVGEGFTFEKEKPEGFAPKTPDLYTEGYHKSPYTGEHVHLLYSIVKDQPLNHARNVAWATGAAILGRESAYTGQKIAWTDMFEKPNPKDKKWKWYDRNLKPTPEDFETGNVDISLCKDGDIRIPGWAA